MYIHKADHYCKPKVNTPVITSSNSEGSIGNGFGKSYTTVTCTKVMYMYIYMYVRECAWDEE